MTLAILTAVGFIAAVVVAARYARRYGYQQGYERARIEQEIHADHLRGELTDLEQRFYALSTQMRAAA
jgi:phage-related minor tail protein